MLYIQEAILHVFDLNTNEPVYSFAGMSVTEALNIEYIQAMIEKVEDSSSMKDGFLVEDNPLLPILKQIDENFIDATRALTEKFYNITKLNPEIPPADLLFARVTLEEVPCLGIFKLNYTDSLTHFVSYDEDVLSNQLVVNRTILPSKRQAIQEGCVINLETMEYHVIEKKHMITEEAEKRYYFSEMFLEDKPKPSLNENIAIIKKAVQKTSKAFSDEEYQVLAETKDALVHSMTEEQVIDHKVIADTIFKDNFAKKEKFYEEVKEMGYVDMAPADVGVMGPKYSKQKFKLNNGIELVVPIDIYKDPEIIEFVNNPDGTMSVMIKNIEKIKNLF